MNKLKMQLDNRETGFTIIEIMVALAIGALLIGGIIQVFISFKQTEKVAGALSRIQESSRLVNDIFMSDSRHIGFVGCLDCSFAVTTTRNKQRTFVGVVCSDGFSCTVKFNFA